MSTWEPLRRSYHLRVFAISLALVFACLAGFLFGVRMEAVAPATGLITARELQEVRTQLAGLVEPGWYEGELRGPKDERLRVRLDFQGNGVTDPSQGEPRRVQQFLLIGGDREWRCDNPRFHRLQPGDELWPGQVIAVVRPDNAPRNGRDPLLPEPLSSAVPAPLSPEAVLRVPGLHARWQVVEVSAGRFQAVNAGDMLARIVPLDPETGQPRELLARLELDEEHCGDLEVGLTVRLASTMFNHRLHGCATAILERLEPWGEPSTNGKRRFQAVARITQAPFRLPLGSSFKAEVIVGQKPVYRIILEQ